MPTIGETITYQELTERQKVAILLMTLDIETAAKIFHYLDPQDVEAIAVEIANLQGVRAEVIDQVVEEFYQLMTAQRFFIEGGLEYAQQLLEKTFGPERAREIIEKIRALTTIRGFDILKEADPVQIASFLSKEHPQIVALILSHLPADQTAAILEEFDDELRADVIMRIATMGKVSPHLIEQIEQVVERVAEATLSQSAAVQGGSEVVASILNRMSSSQTKMIMDYIASKNPQLADEISKKMFLFEDIVLIDDRGVQRILREVDKKDLALALKVASEKVKEKIFKNMSERAAQTIKEELEFMGPVRLKDVEAAQARIVEIIKQLEEREEITISGRGGAEEVFV